MEHRPFISVIIPVWNGARYLDACLNSILRQSWQHFEIIIVDDGSRDATWNMLMRWKKQDARIIPFHQENAGVSEARNTAMRHASGDYYRFVDVDDQLPPDSLEQLVRCAEKIRAIWCWRRIPRCWAQPEPSAIWANAPIPWRVPSSCAAWSA